MSVWTPEKMAKYTKAQKVAYKKRKAKKKYNRNKKPFLAYPKVNAPLMPKSQLVKLKYTTRIQLDPVAVKSSQTHDTVASDMAHHSFVLNCIHDPDYTSTITNSLQHDLDGMRDHQPRMHDQYANFYNYNTVVSAKLKFSFITRQHTWMANTTHSGSGGVTITQIPVVKDPEPCVIGYLGDEYDRNTSINVKLDDILEKNQSRYRKTTQRPNTYNMTKYWSLRKDPMYKTELTQASGQGSDVSWGSTFGSGVTGTANARYCHIFAHPLTTTDDIDPAPIDVLVNLEQIVLLSDLKDIGAS